VTFTRGLIVGKFYPPHSGHHFLIDSALSSCDTLDVLVCDALGERIPAETRASWLRESHPDALVTVIPDLPGKGDDSIAWASHTRQLGFTPDCVFTSEDYGEIYARELGCSHVLVDRERMTHPISGTAVRENPHEHWSFLQPMVRAWFVRRFCIVGAESTGTTTLCEDLAREYNTLWVPEYGREYSAVKSAAGTFEDPWSIDEFVEIAREQQRREEELARIVTPGPAGALLFCDTDALATAVWLERYLGVSSPEVEDLASRGRYEHYFLTGDEIPFVQDGLRDGEHLRGWMHERFLERLIGAELPFTELRGDRYTRVANANAVINGEAEQQA